MSDTSGIDDVLGPERCPRCGWRRPYAMVHTGDSRLPAMVALLTYLDGVLGPPR